MLRLLPLMVLAVLAAGCGKSEAEKEREAKSGRGPVTCEGKAMSGSTGLPADFPDVGNVTFVKAGTTGPTKTADGWTTTSLKEMHDGFVDQFKSAGYKVLFDEIEGDDSEVSYRTKDGATEGQVALRKCEDEDRVSVHVTNRPS